MDEGTGTTVTDYSGNGNHGTINGATWQSGTAPTRTTTASGNAATFDGSNDWMRLDRLGIGTGGLSIGAWVKTTSTDSTAGYPGDAAQNVVGDTTEGIFVGFGVHGGKVRYNHYYSSWENVTGNISVNDGNWHYILATHNQNGSISIYVDGILDNIGAIDYRTSVFGVNAIGRGYSSADYFTGKIDDVRIYNRALSEDEVKYLYETTYRE
jgi:hypothetical protein